MISCFCPHCFLQLEYTDAQAGTTRPCPACAGPVRVPGTPAAAGPGPGRAGSPPPPGLPSRSFLGRTYCRCPHCRKRMRVPEGQQGKTGICPRCHDAFLIPGQRPAPAPAAAPEPVEAQLVCYCPHCDHEMHIAGHNAGKIGTCPACQGPFTIPGGPVTVTVTVLPDPGEPAPAPAGNPRPKKRRRRRALYDAYLLGDPLRDAHREDQVRGYYLILGIIAVTLFLDLIEVVVQIGNSRRVEEAQQQAAKAKTGERLAPARLQDDPLPVAAHWSALIFGLAIEWILLWGLHQGYGWARMGLVMVFVLFWGGCGVCGILSAGAVRDGPPQTGQILVNLLQIVFRLGMAVLMLASRSVTAFAND